MSAWHGSHQSAKITTTLGLPAGARSEVLGPRSDGRVPAGIAVPGVRIEERAATSPRVVSMPLFYALEPVARFKIISTALAP